jgi:protein-S-isoprenylcysteine O-methyltransferase Ste14
VTDAPLIVRWPEALAFWLAYAWAFYPEWRLNRRARPGGEGAPDAGSCRAIVRGNAVATLIACLVAFAAPGAAMRAHREAIFWAGVAVLVLGSVLRRHCFRVLGEHFTYEVRAAPDQPVIERGAYRWVRHPSYTAGVLLFAGIGLALTNWLSLAILLLVPSALYAYRVAVEERALATTIGAPYRDYMRRTKRFVPYLF